MIDDPLLTLRLMAKLHEALPVEARLTPRLAEHFKRTHPERRLPQHCCVTDLQYFGDEGGIVCQIMFDGDEKPLFYASLTHLAFDRRHPVAREIATYQKRRIKRLRIVGTFTTKTPDWSSLNEEEAA